MITKTFSSLWNKMKSWVPRRDDNFLRIVEEVEFRITENQDFLLRVAEEIASQDGIAADVAQEIDHYDVAQEIDTDDIANLIGQELSPSDIAEYIDPYDVAQEIEIEEIASYIDIDYEEIRAGLNHDEIQFTQIDEDSIIQNVIDEVVSRLQEGN